jgi:hypothetical protein
MKKFHRFYQILGMTLLAGIMTAPAFGFEVAGIKFDDTIKVANQDLKLNGAGIRHKLIFKVYAAGLYLQEGKNTVPDVLAAPGVKRVSITMLREVSSEEFGRGFMQGLQQNTDKSDKAKLVNQLQKLGELFASIPELKKGDVLTTDWLPGTGTVLHLNGKRLLDPLPDVAFYNALLKIWLGDKPVDNKLKLAMLGDNPDEKRNTNN